MYYLSHCKTVSVKLRHLRPRSDCMARVASLGAAPCSNQLAMMVVQLVMNKSLTYYGGQSNYGEEVPLACAGIISKVNQVYFSFIIGLSQGLQPIISFNYGAGKYKRAKEAFLTAASPSATGPAYKIPSIPIAIGSSRMSGSRKIIWRVRDKNMPINGLPMAVKQFDVSGWKKFRKVKNKNTLK